MTVAPFPNGGHQSPSRPAGMPGVKEVSGLPARMSFLAFVVAGTLLVWMTAPSLSDPTGRRNRGKALLAEPLEILGTVQEIRRDSGELEVKTDDGTRFLVIPNRSEFQGIPVSSQVRMTVVPIRYTSEGLIISHYSSLEIPSPQR